MQEKLTVFKNMRIITGVYYSHANPKIHLMSGLCLPVDNDGVVRNKAFIDCDLHPAALNAKFENCVFINCSI